MSDTRSWLRLSNQASDPIAIESYIPKNSGPKIDPYVFNRMGSDQITQELFESRRYQGDPDVIDTEKSDQKSVIEATYLKLLRTAPGNDERRMAQTVYGAFKTFEGAVSGLIHLVAAPFLKFIEVSQLVYSGTFDMQAQLDEPFAKFCAEGLNLLTEALTSPDFNVREQALLKMKKATEKMAATYFDALAHEWQKAFTEGRENELMGGMIANGILLVNPSLPFKGASSMASGIRVETALAYSKLHKSYLSSTQASALLDAMNVHVKTQGMEKVLIEVEKAQNAAHLKGPTQGRSKIIESGAQKVEALQKVEVLKAKEIVDKSEIQSLLSEVIYQDQLNIRMIETVGEVKGVDVAAILENLKKSNESPAFIAASWQGTDPYFFKDIWKDIVLKEKTYILGGSPGPSAFYTTLGSLKRVNTNGQLFFEGLQVMPRNGMYRNGITLYRVKANTPAGFARTLKNTDWGRGGLPQIYIPDYKNALEPIFTFRLDNRNATEEIMKKMADFALTK